MTLVSQNVQTMRFASQIKNKLELLERIVAYVASLKAIKESLKNGGR